MEIYSFPAEVFNHIIEELFAIVGPRRCLHLRLVSGVFNASILRTFCNSYVNDRQGPFHTWLDTIIKEERRIASPLMGLLIHAQMIAEPDHPVLALFRSSVQTLKDEEITAHEERRQTMQVCEAAADGLFWHPDHRLDLAWKIDSQRSRPWRGYVNQELKDCDTSNQHLLCVAIITGNVSGVVRLLTGNHQVHVNWEDLCFGRPLHLAARWGHVEIMHILLNHGAQLDAHQDSLTNESSASPPTLALGLQSISWYTDGCALRAGCKAGHIHVVAALLKRGMPATTGLFAQSVRAACNSGSNDILRLLLQDVALHDSHAARLNRDWPDWISVAITEASRTGHRNVLEMFLKMGANVDNEREDHPTRRSSLQIAAWNGHPHIVRTLLDCGASRDFVCRPSAPDSPLIHAVANGHLECATLLVGCGVDLNDNELRESLLHTILENASGPRSQVPMLRLLKELGAHFDIALIISSSKLRAILSTARENGNKDIEELLYSLGWDIDSICKVCGARSTT